MCIRDRPSADPSQDHQTSFALFQVQPSAGPAKGHETSDPPAGDKPSAGPSQDPLSTAYAAALGAMLSSDSEMESLQAAYHLPQISQNLKQHQNNQRFRQSSCHSAATGIPSFGRLNK